MISWPTGSFEVKQRSGKGVSLSDTGLNRVFTILSISQQYEDDTTRQLVQSLGIITNLNVHALKATAALLYVGVFRETMQLW